MKVAKGDSGTRDFDRRSFVKITGSHDSRPTRPLLPRPASPEDYWPTNSGPIYVGILDIFTEDRVPGKPDAGNLSPGSNRLAQMLHGLVLGAHQ